MDFGSLLHVAQKNEQQPKKEIKYYSTKFEPPKKEERSKQLSSNIKKFLARKEAEEKQKAVEANLKRDELLSLRSQDKKATRRVAVMLKRTKSANKSVIQDAVDNDNTAVTLAGPSQPDEDDYGYVSQEASAFYNKMMAKYSNMPEEDKIKLGRSKKRVNVNLSGTKDRVRAALLKEQEEALLPHRRKRRPKEGGDKDDGDPAGDDEVPERNGSDKPRPRSSAPMPPPINFSELLKLAEKKQFEPIKIEPKVEPKDVERPMTKKQKREFEKEKAWRERKEKGLTNGNRPPTATTTATTTPTKSMMPPPIKIPKHNNTINSSKVPKLPNSDMKAKNVPAPRPTTIPSSSGLKKSDDRGLSQRKYPDQVPVPRKTEDERRNSVSKKVEDRTGIPKKTVSADRLGAVKKSTERVNGSSGERGSLEGPKTASKLRHELVKPRAAGAGAKQPLQRVPAAGAVSRAAVPSESSRPKQFPPKDVRPGPRYLPPHKEVRRKPPIGHKRRILDDDDSEYDSEMDDFIDDGPEEGEDYSKYISEIFGYDKSRYRGESYDDAADMESSFSQMMKEEFISSKIGLLEDLEDMKKEAEDKKRKAMLKKKMKK